MIYDAGVIGLGGMGSAVAATLARRGAGVAGFEQFGPVHNLGASHGGTRLIRMAYFEGPDYVPLLRRAYELWDGLEARTGAVVRSRTGALYAGIAQTALIRGTLLSANEHRLDIEQLDAGAMRERFPEFRPAADETILFERDAGAIFPEAAVRAHLDEAAAHGASLRFDTRVETWEKDGDCVRIVLAHGEDVRVRKLAICAGPWLETLLHGARVPITIERNVQHWFVPRTAGAFEPERFPAFARERDGAFFYGFPDYGDGVKCAFHHTGEFTSAQELRRDVSPAEIETVREALASFVPNAAGEHRASSACMYALTPDQHFAIGPHPGSADVYVAGGFSGHGFKFCTVVGEIVANYCTAGSPGHEIGMFAPDRF